LRLRSVMFSSQITRALSQNKYVSKYFGGVFPSDKLPLRVKYPSVFVANTDPAAEKGEHWVCYYFDKKGNVEYFDSFGFPPLNCELHNFYVKNGNECTYNDVQLQGVNSDVCGHYCMAILVNLVRGEPFGEIVERFQGNEPGEYDSLVATLVNKEFNIVNDGNHQRGSGYYLSDQCSCCRHSWTRYNKYTEVFSPF
jgi:hypothetical protein